MIILFVKLIKSLFIYLYTVFGVNLTIKYYNLKTTLLDFA